jgi:hypothetical protein
MAENTNTRECPFPDCDWTYEYEEDFNGELTADHRATMHYKREHAGKVQVQITLETERLLGDRDPSDIRERYLDEYDPGAAFDVVHVRTKVLDESDDHSQIDAE